MYQQIDLLYQKIDKRNKMWHLYSINLGVPTMHVYFLYHSELNDLFLLPTVVEEKFLHG